ncbi:MAG: restriction endonuclease subunit S [Nitrosomonas sp.]|nr:restriction endonuclease subunit S [Nitrosomonas sp.]
MIREDILSDNWPKVRLGDVVEFLDHKRRPITAKDRIPGPYPYYGANGQQDSVQGYIFDEPLVLLAEDGGYFGDPDRVIAYQVQGKCWVNNHAHVLKPRPEINIRYLCRHLEKYDVRPYINGATREKLNKGIAQEIIISLPPLEEQKRIAAILDKADAIRRKRQQTINLTDQLLRSVFLELFGDPVTNPKGWNTCMFSDLIDVLTDYHANGSYQALKARVELKNEKDFALMIRTTDLESGNFNDEVKWVSESAYNFLKKTKMYGGEIILNKIGSAGAVYLMPKLGIPVSLAMNQFMIRCNSECNNTFAYYYLKTEHGGREMKDRIQGAVTKTITKDAVRSIEFYVPPIDMQNRFVDFVQKTKGDLLDKIIRSNFLSESLFSSISQKIFRGEISKLTEAT